MKKTILASCLIGVSLILPACGTSDGDKAEMFSQCRIVLGDRSLSPNLREADTTPDAACTCLEATLDDNGDAREMIATFFERVSTRMSSADESAKEATDALVSGALLPEDAGAEDGQTFADNLSTFNRVVNGMLDGMRENGGACTAI